jgi:hypothetical protein
VRRPKNSPPSTTSRIIARVKVVLPAALAGPARSVKQPLARNGLTIQSTSSAASEQVSRAVTKRVDFRPSPNPPTGGCPSRAESRAEISKASVSALPPVPIRGAESRAETTGAVEARYFSVARVDSWSLPSSSSRSLIQSETSPFSGRPRSSRTRTSAATP